MKHRDNILARFRRLKRYTMIEHWPSGSWTAAIDNPTGKMFYGTGKTETAAVREAMRLAGMIPKTPPSTPEKE